MDQVSQSGAASQAAMAEARKAERGTPARSFKEVASERPAAKKAGTDEKKGADKAAKKDGDPLAKLRYGEGGDDLQARLEGELGAQAEAQAQAQAQQAQTGDVLEGEQQGCEAKLGAQQRSQVATEILVSGSEQEAKALFVGKSEGDRAEAALLRGGADMERVHSAQKSTSQEQQAVEGHAVETEVKADVESVKTDDDLKLELEQNLFATGVGNPLMAQRATEPQPVEEAKAVREIPQAIVDKVVDRARFGVNAEGATEFQVDLKQDVFGGAELKVFTKDGKVTVEMVSDDSSLHQAAQQLADQLKAKGLQVEGVRVMTKAEAKESLAAARGLDGGAAGAAGAQGKRARSLYDDDEDEQQPRRRR